MTAKKAKAKAQAKATAIVWGMRKAAWWAAFGVEGWELLGYWSSSVQLVPPLGS
jgi:hypothetical protein